MAVFFQKEDPLYCSDPTEYDAKKTGSPRRDCPSNRHLAEKSMYRDAARVSMRGRQR